MEKFIVKHRKFILALAVILIVPALIGMFNTRINYDLLTYLPDSMETVQGQDELLNDFGKGAFAIVITEDLDDAAEQSLENDLKQIPHVDTVVGFGSLADNNLPSKIIPDSLYEKFTHGTEKLAAVFFDTSTSADETLDAVTKIREVTDGHAHLSGMSAFSTDLKKLNQEEELFYVIIASSLALLVMLIFLDNWLAPILFLASIGIMILINLGTNIIFGEISYITKSLSAILQLAVTMDYSIFLWHSYREYLAVDPKKNSNKAMEKAIKATFSSVLGSSATTVAGFLALCFMTFTLGFDLGLVMAKGTLLGVLGSVTVLPALILTFNKPLLKLDHKSILPKFTKVSSLIVKYAPIFLIAFIAILPPAYIGYQNTNDNVYYTIADSLPQDMDFAVANKILQEHFGMSNVHMTLTDAHMSEQDSRAMARELEEIPGIKTVLNAAAVIGADVPLEVLPDGITDLLKSDKWELTLMVSEYKTATDEIADQIAKINEVIKSHDQNALLVSESASTNDMVTLMSDDFRNVNFVSIGAIFVIIAIATGSLSLPFILIAVIESAIFINLGISSLVGEQLSFITPICISTIQLGATVDYAILMTTRYKRERLANKSRKDAVTIAIRTSIPSIIVSGAVFFAATIGVALYSRADMISSICMLMARGAAISIFAVPCFLGPLLYIADPLIIRTTKGMKKLTKETK
ncbi:MMPL family transporter [Candidatus Saccharibacteria bacterium]|nr:MMPL family transporter [Candidatus Saccharibacteria bacterium]